MVSDPSLVRVSVLARHTAPGYMGALSRTCDISGESLLTALVSEPTTTVAALTGDETWRATEAAICAELAAAPDQATRNAIKKRIPAVVPARFNGAERSSSECLGRQVIGHDFDHLSAETFEAACESIRAKLPGRFLAIHTTATERNADGTWRLRVFELLDREATPDEWEARVKPHMRSLGEHDANAVDVARLLFCPVRTAGYRWHVLAGPRTPLDALTARPALPATAPAAGPREISSAAPTNARATRARSAAIMLGMHWPSSGRHRAQLALAGALRAEDFSEIEALELLCLTCRTAGDEDRPKRAATVARTYARAPESQVTGWATLRTLVDPLIVDAVRGALGRDAEWTERTLSRLVELSAAPEAVPCLPSTEWGVLDWSVVDPPITWVVEGIVQEATVSLAFGLPNSLKTWALYQMASAVGSGTQWLGRGVAQGLVVILDFESSPRQARRRMRLLKAHGLTNVRYVNPKEMLDDPALWERLVNLRPVLVVVDSLSRGMIGRDENDQSVMTIPLDAAKRLARECGTSTVFIHHKNKSAREGQESARGSGAITAAAEGWLEFLDFEKLEGGVQRVRLHCARLKESVPFDDMTLELSDAHGLVEVKASPKATERPGDAVDNAKRELLLKIDSHGEISECELLRKAGFRGRTAQVGKDAVKELLGSGKIDRCPVGRGFVLRPRKSAEAQRAAILATIDSGVHGRAEILRVTGADQEHLTALGNDRVIYQSGGGSWLRVGRQQPSEHPFDAVGASS